MLYRKQTMAMPTKNSDEEAESPTMCVDVTEWLQIVAFPSTSGTWLNLATIQDGRFTSSFTVTAFYATIWVMIGDRTSLRLSPKWVVKVGVESFIPAIATEERYDVPPWESAAASKSKYGRELFGQTRENERLGKWLRLMRENPVQLLGK